METRTSLLSIQFCLSAPESRFPTACLRTVGCRSKLELLTFRLLNHPANYSQPRKKTELCMFPYLGRSVGKTARDFISDKLGALSGLLIIFAVSMFSIYSSAAVLGMRWMKSTAWFQTVFQARPGPCKNIIIVQTFWSQ